MTEKTTNDRYQMKELLSAIRNAGSILLFPHIAPDGDTLGSTLAMKLLLEQMGKTVTIVAEGTVPHNLFFLPDLYAVRPLEEAERTVTIKADTLAIAVDVSAIDRLGKAQAIFEKAPHTAQVDHHGTNPAYAQVNVIDGDAPATAIVVHRLYHELNEPMGRDAAICLYAALSTDTGNFVYDSTNAEAFRMMAELMDAGLPIATYGRMLFRRKEKAHVALLGKVLPTMKYFADGSLASLKLSYRDMLDAGATNEHSDGCVDYAIDSAGVKMAFFAKETEEGRIKFSLRALMPYRVDTVAAKFGGGGHQLAAGCSMEGPLEKAVERMEQELEAAYRSEGANA